MLLPSIGPSSCGRPASARAVAADQHRPEQLRPTCADAMPSAKEPKQRQRILDKRARSIRRVAEAVAVAEAVVQTGCPDVQQQQLEGMVQPDPDNVSQPAVAGAEGKFAAAVETRRGADSAGKVAAAVAVSEVVQARTDALANRFAQMGCAGGALSTSMFAQAKSGHEGYIGGAKGSRAASAASSAGC